MSEINHRNSIKIEARKDGKLIGTVSIPTNNPKHTYDFIGNALGALAVAGQRKMPVVTCVCSRWKAWIIVHVLRATK